MILQNFRLGIFQQHLKSLFKLFNKVIVEVLIAIAMPFYSNTERHRFE